MTTMAGSAPLKAPSQDKRWKLVEGTMRRYAFAPHALIETLHTVQDCFGCLDRDSLRFVAQGLRLPLSKVYGVATFYHFFTMQPPGKHTCVVCLGTACYIKGSQQVLDAVTKEFGVKPGETSPDGKLSVLTARCIGSCGLAPSGVIDGEVKGKLDAAQLIGQLKEKVRHDA